MDPDKASRQSRFSLVACLISRKIIFKPAVHSAILAAWRFALNLRIKDVGPNRFLVTFSCAEHKNWVLFYIPWNIKGFLLVLREWHPSASILSLDFSQSPYWIQIHGVPLDRMSSANARLIGGKLGRVLDVDLSVDADDGELGFLRVRVDVNILEPLSPGFSFTSDSTAATWFSFKFERLSGICFNCGCIDHLESWYDAELPHPHRSQLGPLIKPLRCSQGLFPLPLICLDLGSMRHLVSLLMPSLLGLVRLLLVVCVLLELFQPHSLCLLSFLLFPLNPPWLVLHLWTGFQLGPGRTGSPRVNHQHLLQCNFLCSLALKSRLCLTQFSLFPNFPPSNSCLRCRLYPLFHWLPAHVSFPRLL